MLSPSVDPAARREAIELRKCPVQHGQTELDVLAETLMHPSNRAVMVAEQKPATFGLFSIFIDQMLQKTFAERASFGPLGLQKRQDDGSMRVATLQDATSWDGLSECWNDTLRHSMTEVINRPDNRTSMITLRGLWRLRSQDTRDLGTQLASGIDTATNSCMTIAYGMNRYLDTLNIQGGNKGRIIERSHGPIIAIASLESGQHAVFAEANLGVRSSKVAEETLNFTSLSEVHDDIYTLGDNDRLNLSMAAEDFQTSDGRRVGDTPAYLPGARIGCPILLTPQQTQELWVAHSQTAQIAGLI